MRFIRLLQEKRKTRNVLSIPVAEFEATMRTWMKDMAGRGYQKKTRIHHVQEALDSIATALEAKSPSAGPADVLKSPHWVAAVKVAAEAFPKETHTYYPTPGEQEIRFRLVRNAIATRLLRDKVLLMDEFRKSFKGTEQAHTNKAALRLQFQMLAASGQGVLAEYGKSIYADWDKWYQWNRAKSDTDITVSRSASAVRSGGLARADGSGSAQAFLGKRFEHGEEGDRFRASGEAGLVAEGAGHAGVIADRSSMTVAAKAGAEAFVGARTSVEFEVELTARVRGKDIDWLKVTGGTSASLGIGASVEAKAGARGFGGTLGGGHSWDMTEEDADKKKRGKIGNVASNTGLGAGIEGEVTVGFAWQGEINAEVLETMQVGISSDFFAGAKASAGAQFFVNTGGIKLAAHADAFAGVEFSVSPVVKIKDRKRKLDLFTVNPTLGVSFGAGAEAKAGVEAGWSNVGAAAKAEAAIGLGFDLGLSGGVSPRTLALVCYDHILVHAGHGIRSVVRQRCSPTSKMRRAVDRADHWFGVKTDKGEINQVYFQCRNMLVGQLTALDSEADKLHRMVMKKDFRQLGRHVPQVKFEDYEDKLRSTVLGYDSNNVSTGIDDSKKNEALQQMAAAQQKFMTQTGKSSEALDIRFIREEMEKPNGYVLPASAFGVAATI